MAVRRLEAIAQAVGVKLPADAGSVQAQRDEARRVPSTESYELWETMIAHGVFERMTGDDARALRREVSSRFPNLVRLLARASVNLDAGFRLVERYWPLVTTAYGARVVEHDALLCLRLEPVPERLGARAELWFVFAAMVEYVQTWPESPVRARLALRDRTLPIAHAALEQLLGAPIELGAPFDELRVHAQEAAIAFRHADEALVRLLCAQADQLLAALGDDPSLLSSKLLRWMEQAFADGRDVSVEHAAAEFGLSARTLRRMLDAESMTFLALRERVRERLALAWLDELPDARLATRLGYSDASAFRRAFRRWTGKTPSQVRGGS